MSGKKKKTVLRTFRITEEVDDLIQKRAEEKEISVNTLISTILTRYVEWERYTEKFGFITMPRDVIRSFLDTVEDTKVSKVGQEVGGRLPKEFMMFRFKKMNIDTIIALLSLQSKYGRIFEYELETDERSYTITLHHELGRKWSIYLKGLFSEMIKTTLGSLPQIETTKSSVTVKFFIP